MESAKLCYRLFTTVYDVKHEEPHTSEDTMFRITRRHWVISIAAIAAILVLVHIVGIDRRNAQYRRALKAYSEVLRPGMKRSEVENYFIMSKYVSFDRSCCVGPKQGAFDDLVEIGHEKAGWVCQEQFVYVAFEFSAVEPNKKWVADSDRLVGTSLYRSVCLDLLP
jgi:hypothetical protein